jgi:hypothetical protein
MAIVAVEPQSGVPFVVEPVQPSDVQFWGTFAGQMVSRSAFRATRHAYFAFSMQDDAFGNFQNAVRWVHAGEVGFALGWMDLVVSTLQYVAEAWRETAGNLEEDQELLARAGEWHAYASSRAEESSRLMWQVVDWVVASCQHIQVALPEYTQKALAPQPQEGQE